MTANGAKHLATNEPMKGRASAIARSHTPSSTLNVAGKLVVNSGWQTGGASERSKISVNANWRWIEAFVWML